MPTQNLSPTRQRDGTLTAIIETTGEPLPGGTGLRVRVPAGSLNGPVAGRYVLARCGALDEGALKADSERMQQWSFPLRRPLWLTGVRQATQANEHETWSLLLPRDSAAGDHPTDAWLRRQQTGAAINLLGPLGNGFALRAGSRNLLLLADATALAAGVAPLLALVDERLDDGGRVTLVVRFDKLSDRRFDKLNDQRFDKLSDQRFDKLSDRRFDKLSDQQIDVGAWLRGRLPLAVELHLVAATEWDAQVAASLAWSDQLCAALPMADYRGLAEAIQARRFFLEEGFAQGLVQADLACGVGACLACVVPLSRGGWTRACVHGPVLDLVRLVG